MHSCITEIVCFSHMCLYPQGRGQLCFSYVSVSCVGGGQLCMPVCHRLWMSFDGVGLQVYFFSSGQVQLCLPVPETFCVSFQGACAREPRCDVRWCRVACLSVLCEFVCVCMCVCACG